MRRVFIFFLILVIGHYALSALMMTSKVRRGQASWYSRRSPGIRRRTANNERFNDQALTAAMWNVPFHTKVRVTNIENDKSVIVRINDRGPHYRYVRQGRVIDLTKAAFHKIASHQKGLIDVVVEVLE